MKRQQALRCHQRLQLRWHKSCTTVKDARAAQVLELTLHYTLARCLSSVPPAP